MSLNLWGQSPQPCPPEAVCAYEWEGRLYHSQKEVEQAKRQRRLDEARSTLYNHFKKYDRGKDFNHGAMWGLSVRSVVDILVRDWDQIDKLVRIAKS